MTPPIKDYGNNSLRKVKADKIDSRKTAKYALDNWTELWQYTSMDKTRYQLKVLNRQCSHLTADRTAQKNSLITILDMTYQEVNEFFTSPARADRTQKQVDFVRTFWHVDCVEGISPAAFTERYQNWYKKNKYNFSSDKTAKIHADAQDQITMMPKDELTKAIVQQSVDSLTAISSAEEQLRAEMLKLSEQLPEFPVVMAMNRVGNSLGPQLMTKPGAVNRFAHRSAVTTFAGVDPGANRFGAYEQSVPASPNMARRSRAGRCS